jgi:hypothetical protein
MPASGEEIAGLRAELAAVQRTLGLAMLKASNKRLRNRGQREPATLEWIDDGGGDKKAEGPAGTTYLAFSLSYAGCRGFFSASLMPAQGRARLPKMRQAIGRFKTLAEAMACCEEHARSVT